MHVSDEDEDGDGDAMVRMMMVVMKMVSLQEHRGSASEPLR